MGNAALKGQQLFAIRINTSNMKAMVEFFEALEIQITDRKVTKGGNLIRGEIGQLEILVSEMGTNTHEGPPKMSMRLRVSNLDEKWEKVRKIAGFQTVMGVEELPEWKIGVVIDPDGRAFELIEPYA